MNAEHCTGRPQDDDIYMAASGIDSCQCRFAFILSSSSANLEIKETSSLQQRIKTLLPTIEGNGAEDKKIAILMSLEKLKKENHFDTAIKAALARPESDLHQALASHRTSSYSFFWISWGTNILFELAEVAANSR